MELYKDRKKSAKERAKDLLQRMSLKEKLAQMQCMMVFDAEMVPQMMEEGCGVGEVMVSTPAESPAGTAKVNRRVIDAVMANDRFHIPPIIHAEALSGAVIPAATVFPSAIGLGATFDPEAVQNMADTISKQMRVTGYRQALSPVMDLGRDPRWGRIGETYGEDPTLCAMMSVAYTRGLQGEHCEKGVAATGKHFLGYSFGDGGLNMSSNPIPARELREDYAKPFQAAVTEGHLHSIMNSYGSIDQEMVIGSAKILNGLLREEMKFEGAVVSDYESIEKLVTHRISADMTEAGIQALEAGLDIECPMPKGYADGLRKAVEEGRVSENLIDRAVLHVLETKFALGLFEHPYPETEEKVNEIFFDAVPMERSLRAARESVVLLKNDGVLPLSKELKKIAVVGAHADSIRQLFGCYTMPAAVDMGMSRAFADVAGMDAAEGSASDDGFVPETFYEGSNVRREREDVRQALRYMYGSATPTVLDAIRKKVQGTEIVYEKGCDYAGSDRSGFAAAIRASETADVVILAVGGKYGWGDSCTVGEGIDSVDLALTGVQEELALQLCATGKPVILLHMDARPLSSQRLKENCAAILECWYPGSTGGTAIADILFGDYNPAGRLPVTALKNVGQIPCYAGQKTGNGYQAIRRKMSLCKYVENDTEPLYPFGHGLSYTAFTYSDLQVTERTAADEKVEISFTVKNTGNMAGEEVVQLYVEDVLSSMLRPNREFAGGRRIFLNAGEETHVTFSLKASQFAFLSKEMEWTVEAGQMRVYVGASSDDIRLEGQFEITNTEKINGWERGFYAISE